MMRGLGRLLFVLLLARTSSSSSSPEEDVFLKPSSPSASDGLFTSSADLQDLLWTEAELVRGMREYIREEEERIAKLKG